MRFLSFLSLWTITCWLWINKIPEVAKTKTSKPKRYSLSKLRLGHAPLKRLIQTRSACLHHDVGRFAKHHPNIHAKKEGVTFVLAVVLLLPPSPCHGGALWANPNSWFELCFLMQQHSCIFKYGTNVSKFDTLHGLFLVTAQTISVFILFFMIQHLAGGVQLNTIDM